MIDSLAEQGFEVKFAFVAWVPPLKLKNSDGSQVESMILDAKNKAFGYFLNIFERALGDCTAEIQFKSPQLNQTNVVRAHILEIISSKSLKHKEKSARALAERLAPNAFREKLLNIRFRHKARLYGTGVEVNRAEAGHDRTVYCTRPARSKATRRFCCASA